MQQLQPHHPAESLEISPEALEVANCYLQTQSAEQVASTLAVDIATVTKMLARREVKAYIDQVFFDMGFNNRFKMRAAMDAIIARKFQELDEAGIGSNKDILDILSLSHKMTMETLDKQLELEKLQQSGVRSQTNIQINDGGSTNYSSLIHKLVNNQL